MKLTYYISILSILIIFSCKKEPIPELVPNQSNGIFINGTLGEKQINLSSTDNYYMYSNYIFDSIKEVYVFSGELKERYCTDCGPSVMLKVSNNKKSPGGLLNFTLDSILNRTIVNWDGVTSEDFCLAEIILDFNDGNQPLSSMNSYQSHSNKLQILEVELYKSNELGQSTIKVKFKGQATLTTILGEELFVFNGTFAFAFPE